MSLLIPQNRLQPALGLRVCGVFTTGIGDDVIQMRTQGRSVPDSFNHGTIKLRIKSL